MSVLNLNLVAFASGIAPAAGQFRGGRVVKAIRREGNPSYVLVDIGLGADQLAIVPAHKLGARANDELARFEAIEKSIAAGAPLEIVAQLGTIGVQAGGRPSYPLDERVYLWEKAEADIYALVGSKANVAAKVIGVVSGEYGPFGLRMQVTEFFTALLHVSEVCDDEIAAAFLDECWDGHAAKKARSALVQALAARFETEGPFDLLVAMKSAEKKPARGEPRPGQAPRMQLLVSVSQAAVYFNAKEAGVPVPTLVPVVADIHVPAGQLTPAVTVVVPAGALLHDVVDTHAVRPGLTGTVAHVVDPRPQVSEAVAMEQVVASLPAQPAVINDTLAATVALPEVASVAPAAAASVPTPTINVDEEKVARVRAAIGQLEVEGRTYKGPIRRLLPDHVEVHIGNGVPVLLPRNQLPNRGKYEWKNGDKVEGIQVLSVNVETLEVVVKRIG
ncbi:MAG: hypothetical protein K2W82_17170 [Candidatus Obscuribacterales bacterium]|nr:hypothetical protein [Candidatus Obscuribacterales bacterium]